MPETSRPHNPTPSVESTNSGPEAGGVNRGNRRRKIAPLAKPTRWYGYLALALITLTGFYPILGSPVLWPEYETMPRSPFASISDWTEAWTLASIRHHDPITLTSYFVEQQLPFSPELTHRALNLLLHLLAAVLFLKIAEALRLPGALFAAMVFALHPMVMPAVFWSGYRELLMATVFTLGALLCGIRNRHKSDFILLLVLSALSFLSHPGTLVLPIALAFFIFFNKRFTSLPDYNRVLPVFCIALFFAVWLQPGRAATEAAAKNELLAIGSQNMAFFIQQGLLPDEPALFHTISENQSYSAGATNKLLPFAFFLPFYILIGFNFKSHWARGMLCAVTCFLLFSMANVFHEGTFLDGQPAHEPARIYLALPFMLWLVACGTAAFFSLGGQSGLLIWRVACGILIASQLVAAHSAARSLANPTEFWRNLAEKWPTSWQARLAYLDSTRNEAGFTLPDSAAVELMTSILAQQPERHELKYDLLTIYLRRAQGTNAVNEYRRILRDTQPTTDFLAEAADFFDRMGLEREAAIARNRIRQSTDQIPTETP